MMNEQSSVPAKYTSPLEETPLEVESKYITVDMLNELRNTIEKHGDKTLEILNKLAHFTMEHRNRKALLADDKDPNDYIYNVGDINMRLSIETLERELIDLTATYKAVMEHPVRSKLISYGNYLATKLPQPNLTSPSSD